ncbi:type II secretion system major pseudopilin GspG [Spirochaeta dissipatitropha]
MKKLYQQGADGFTFIETIITISIIILLSGSVGFSAFRFLDKARFASATAQIEIYSAALQSYYLDNGHFPSTEQGLSALWEKPYLHPVPGNWFGPYIDRPIDKDPWGNEYQYLSPGINGEAFTVISPGLQP